MDPLAARRFAVLAKSSSDLIAELDVTGRIYYASPSHEAVLGWAPQELVGSSVMDLMHPDDRSLAAAALEGRSGRRYATLRFRFRRKQGGWLYFDARGQGYRDSSGDVRVLVLSRDISERIRRDEEVARQSASLALLASVSESIHRELDPARVATLALDAIAGYLPFQTLTLQIPDESGEQLELVASFSRSERTVDLHKGRISPGTAAHLALRERRIVTVHAPGEKIEARFRDFMRAASIQTMVLVPLLYQDRAEGFISLLSHEEIHLAPHEERDLLAVGTTVASALVSARYVRRIEDEVRVRARAEDELRARSEALAAINRVAVALSGRFDLDEVAAAAAAAVAAYTGLPIVGVFSLDADEKNVTRVGTHVAAGVASLGLDSIPVDRDLTSIAFATRQVAVSQLDSDPRVSPAISAALHSIGIRNSAVVPLIFQDKVVGTLGLSSREPLDFSELTRDTLLAMGRTLGAALVHAKHVARLQAAIEEREAAESALRESQVQLLQSQKMEALGLLAGGISHDFNNLLTVISGHAELLRDEASQPQPDLRGVEEILQASERARELTRQLLTFSRKQVVQPRILDVNEAVGELHSMLRRVIGETIDLTVELAADAGCVKADPGQLSQVLVNLAVNACDAMPAGGRLGIATARIDRDGIGSAHRPGLAPGEYVQIRVWDTGAGMDAATQERIFEPFFTTKETGQGTGLGLSTVYGIVHQSGGRIEVHSRPGLGTTFTIALPRVPSAQESTGPRVVPSADGMDSSAPAAASSSTILLVEDDPAVRRLAKRVLERHGYGVIEAGTGAAALAELARADRGIDLVLTDVVMPDMSGPQLGRHLSERRPDLPVLYMSGYPEHSAPQLSNLPPGTGFLSKPFTGKQLVQRIEQMLART